MEDQEIKKADALRTQALHNMAHYMKCCREGLEAAEKTDVVVVKKLKRDMAKLKSKAKSGFTRYNSYVKNNGLDLELLKHDLT